MIAKGVCPSVRGYDCLDIYLPNLEAMKGVQKQSGGQGGVKEMQHGGLDFPSAPQVEFSCSSPEENSNRTGDDFWGSGAIRFMKRFHFDGASSGPWVWMKSGWKAFCLI